MKIAVVFLAIVAYAYAQAGYTDKFDSVDLDSILKSNRLLTNYVNCLLDKGPCTPEGKELKNNLPDALATGCSKCTEKQRTGSEKVIRTLVNQKPAIWAQLATKYDPNDEYRVKFQDQAKRVGISV